MKNNRILLYVHFNKNNGLAEHVVYQLEKLRTVFKEIVFISNSPLSIQDGATVSEIVDTVIQRENIGYDFAAWRDGIKAVGWGTLAKFDSLTTMNDTCFGPLYDLGAVYAEMEQRDIDFWGMTDHAATEKGMPGTDVGIPEHIQSYYTVFNQNVVKSKSFQNFWKTVKDHTDVFKVIQESETQLTGILKQAGFKSSTFFDTNAYTTEYNIATPNYSELQPLITIKVGLPFVKVKSVIWTSYASIIRLIKQKSSYPVRLIDEHVASMNLPIVVKRKKSLKVIIIEKTKRDSIAYRGLRRAYRSAKKLAGK